MLHIETLALAEYLIKTAAAGSPAIAVASMPDDATKGLQRLGSGVQGSVMGQRYGAAGGASLGLLISLLNKHKGFMHDRAHTPGEDVAAALGGGLAGAGIGKGLGYLIGTQKNTQNPDMSSFSKA